MTSQRPRRYQLSAILALAGAALLATSGVALADTETGQHGDYLFKDNAVKYGATCIYAASGSKYKLTQIVVKAPGLWWPDTASGNNKEHGTVGWQLFVQISRPGANGPWHTLYATDTQQKTAHEDHPAYDKADQAKLAQWTLAINGAYKHKPNAYARVKHEAFWYNPDDSIMGTVVHDQLYYKWQNVPGQSGSTGACPIHYTAV